MDHKELFPKELIKAVGESVGSVYFSPQIVDNDKGIYGVDGIVSSIYLKGDIIGKISIFTRSTSAARIVARMLGIDEISDDSPDVLDGVGEVLNIMAGCFKMNLDQHKVSVEISVPSTRLTSINPIGRWENNIDQVYLAKDVLFRVSLSYRFALKEETVAPPVSAEAKLKLSASDLLKQILQKKK